jgi:pimeloyl-ACP methyl ester carboxylesterase
MDRQSNQANPATAQSNPSNTLWYPFWCPSLMGRFSTLALRVRNSEDFFDVVIPSMPGFGYSERPQSTGWGPDRIARAWDVLMKRLRCKRYVSQGDWGSVVADAMARQKPDGLLGIHVNMPPTVPAAVAKALKNGDPAPSELSDKEKAAYKSLNDLYTKNGAYASLMVTRPQTLGYGLTDSSAGLAAFFYDKFNDWTHSGGNAEKVFTRDEMLDRITLYWITNTATSSARRYWEKNKNNFNAVDQKTAEISIPVAVTVFSGEIYRAPKRAGPSAPIVTATRPK